MSQGEITMISKYVVDGKVSLYLLICIVLWDKLSEKQRDLVDMTAEDIDSLARLLWPKKYMGGMAAANFVAPDVQATLKRKFKELAELDPGQQLEDTRFRLWFSEQANRFGEWLEVTPEE